MAMRGIVTLHRNDVPFNYITVLTEDAKEQPGRLFRFFRDNGIQEVGFNVEEQEGIHTSSYAGGRHGAQMPQLSADVLAAQRIC